MNTLVNRTQQPQHLDKETAGLFLRLGIFSRNNQFFDELFQILKKLKDVVDIIAFIAQANALIHQHINGMFSTIGIAIPDEQLFILMESPVETYQSLIAWYEIFTKNLTREQQVKYHEYHGETFIPTDDLLAFLKNCYSSDIFKVYIKTLTGRNIELFISSQTSIDDIHNLISDNDGVPVEHQRLIFAGKQLEGKRLAAAYCITKESTISLVLRLRGGMHHESSTGGLWNEYNQFKENLNFELRRILEEYFESM